MKYVVVLTSDTGTHVFAPPGGGWIDPDPAQAWGEQYLKDHGGGSFEVCALEYTV